MSMTFFRNKRNSYFTMAIFGAIIITFIYWGGYTKEGGSHDALTSVNGEDIPYNDFHRILARQLETYGQILGAGKKLNDNVVQMVERQVASSLIMRKVMSQKANSMGIVIGDEEILSLLQKNTAFHDPKLNRFSPTVYQAVLEANNLRPSTFEADIREELAADRLRDLVEQSISVSDKEVEESYKLQGQEMTLESAVFDPKELAAKKKVQISNEAAETYFKAHSSEFLSGEKRSATVGTLKIAAWNENLAPTEDEIKNYFESKVKDSKEEQWNEPRAHVHHILIADASDKGLKKSQDLAKGISNFETFKSVAKRMSEDYSNASQGGDLGYFNEKTMVKPFSAAVFGKSKLNTVIGPVKTDFGHHLLWIVDRTTEEKTLANRKEQIAHLLKQEKMQTELANLKDHIAETLKAKDPVAALKAKGFEFTEVKGFDSKTRSNDVPFVILQSAIRSPKDEWKGPEDFERNLYVFKVTQVIPPAPLAFAEAKEAIVKKLEAEETEKSIRALTAKLQKGEISWEKLSAEGAKLDSKKNTKPYQLTEVPGFGQSENLLKAVHSLKASTPISQPLMHEGKWIIYRGTNWSTPAATIPADQATKIREELLSKKRSTILENYVQGLVKTAHIPDSFRKKYNL